MENNRIRKYRALLTAYFVLNAFNVFRWLYMLTTIWFAFIGCLSTIVESTRLYFSFPLLFVAGGWLLSVHALWAIALVRAYSQKYTMFMVVSVLDYIVYIISVYYIEFVLGNRIVENMVVLYGVSFLYAIALVFLLSSYFMQKRRQKNTGYY